MQQCRPRLSGIPLTRLSQDLIGIDNTVVIGIRFVRGVADELHHPRGRRLRQGGERLDVEDLLVKGSESPQHLALMRQTRISWIRMHCQTTLQFRIHEHRRTAGDGR